MTSSGIRRDPSGLSFLMSRTLCWLTALSTAVFLSAPLVLRAEELKLEAILLWATNEEKPTFSEKNLAPVDPETASKLTNIFKWKHYFVVKKVQGTVPSRGTNTFVMSKDCTIQITELPGPKVKVALIGKGKPVNETTEDLVQGGCFTIGGPVKDNTAWFVMVKQLK